MMADDEIAKGLREAWQEGPNLYIWDALNEGVIAADDVLAALLHWMERAAIREALEWAQLHPDAVLGDDNA
jgi:hypothetical protein